MAKREKHYRIRKWKVYARITYTDASGKRRDVMRLAESRAHAKEVAAQRRREFKDHRTRRSMRDLRRYTTPVTINNPAQVNIADEGKRQVNAVKVET